MNKFKFVIPLAIMLVGCGKIEDGIDSGPGPVSGPAIVYSSDVALKGEILVKLRPGTTPSGNSGINTRSAGNSFSMGNQEMDRILMTMGEVRFERLFPECGRFEARTKSEGLDRWYILNFDKALPCAEVSQMLSDCDCIEKIEYSIPTTCSSYTSVPDAVELPSEWMQAAASRQIPFPFNEGERARRMQWHYNNPGQVYANATVYGADANVYAAWELCTGHPDVIVAVIDQGVKVDHEDLAANMWVNTKEIPGNGIDDDGNGYVDDIHGWNYVNDSPEIFASEENVHGTHVAGTIAAVNNNGIGVNGIAGGSGKGDGVKIMSLEVLGSSESGTSGGGMAAEVRAMKYAADNGAVISQNSWGFSAGVMSRNDWSRGSYSSMAEAIGYFKKYAGIDENGEQTGPMAGGIVIFASGNDASEELCYPAADPDVVSVSATSYLGTPSYFTNFGRWVTMSAPGGDLSVNPTYGGIYSTTVSKDGGSSYGSLQGTSMACPHVSGACALAISYYYGAEKRKGLTAELLKDALLASTRPIDPFCQGLYRGNMGCGTLDTYALLCAVNKVKTIPAQEMTVGQEVRIALGEYFYKTDVFTCSVDDGSIVNASVQNKELIISALKPGTATIRLGDGRALLRRVEVIVK